MNDINYSKISFEEKAKRIVSGRLPSLQSVYKAIETFCKTPVVPTLEDISEYTSRRDLCKCLKGEINIKRSDGTRIKRRAVDVTFGELAIYIATKYLSGNDGKNSEVARMLMCI